MYSPAPPPVLTDDLVRYVYDELQRISNDLNTLDFIRLEVQNAAPAKPQQGMVMYADGTNWNPGSGEGIYFYNSAGSWVKL